MSKSFMNIPFITMRADAQDSSPYCRPITAQSLLPYVLVILQCACLHPTFVHSKLAKSIRIGLTPINVIWCITFPFRYCFRPLETAGQHNMGLASIAFYSAVKSLEWGFATGPYYKRPLQTIDGVQRWVKVKEIDHSSKMLQEKEPCSIFKLSTWTILQLSSMRGFNFTWGPAAVANTQSTSSSIRRLARLIIPMTCALALIVLTRDSPLGTPTSGLLSIGVPNFPGLKIIAESAYTTSFGVYLACTMDSRFTLITIVTEMVHKVASSFQLPDHVLELIDPINIPPMFGSPHEVESIAELWGQAWHTFLQRMFIVGGAKPAIWFTEKLGGSLKLQRLMGLFGIYACSAVVHEYLIYVISQPPHSNPHLFPAFPGSGLYFILQPLAVLIEPFIIPMIPKRLGGGRLWVFTFSVVAAHTFRNQYLGAGRLSAAIPPLSQWSWLYILSPVKV